MLSLKTLLTQWISQAFIQAGQEARWGEVAVSDRPDLADFQCNGALGCAKSQRKNPRELAEQIMAAAQSLSGSMLTVQGLPYKEAATLSLAGPGFINIRLSDSFLAAYTEQGRNDTRLGVSKVERPRTVVIDLGGPNVAKALHVGHLRSPILGDALVRIYRFMGDTVIGDNHLGDWGTPMGMIICELKRRKPDLPYFKEGAQGPFPAESPVTSQDLEEMYPLASKLCEQDPAARAEAVAATAELQSGRAGYKALWQHFVRVTIQEHEKDFASLGIKFDCWLGESFYEDKMPPMIERLKKSGIAQMSEGALVIPLASELGEDAPPLILQKSGGGYLYHTSDLATVEYRVNHFKADLALYAVDKRQTMHFKQVFAAAKIAGMIPNTTLVHTAFGTMNGTDGKPFKTRDGGTVKLKDLLSMVFGEAKKRMTEIAAERNYPTEELERVARQVGIAILKYGDLKQNRVADYVFDLERFSQFEGNTGPYLQYAAVRIKSILRKAQDAGQSPGPIVAATNPAERLLILETLKLPEVLGRAYSLYEPHHLCDFGFSLSQAFNSFYRECHILSETDAARRGSWLSLCKLVHDEIALCLELLGIELPERM